MKFLLQFCCMNLLAATRAEGGLVLVMARMSWQEKMFKVRLANTKNGLVQENLPRRLKISFLLGSLPFFLSADFISSNGSGRLELAKEMFVYTQRTS